MSKYIKKELLCERETQFDFNKIKSRVLSNLRPVFFYSGVMNILVLASPLYMIQLFDRVLGSRSIETLTVLTLAVIGAHLVFSYLDSCRLRTLQTLGSWLSARMDGPVLEQSITNATRSAKSVEGASLDDVRTVRNFLGSPATIALLDAPWVLLFLCMMWLLHPVFGVIALVGASTLFTLALLNNKLTKSLVERDAQTKSLQDSLVKTSIDNAGTITAMGMGQTMRKKLNDAADTALQSRDKSEALNSRISSISRFVRLSLQTMTMGAGAMLAINGEIASGAMIAASVMLGRALAPVEQSINGWRTAVRARSAWSSLEKSLQSNCQPAEQVTLPAPLGKLALNNVGLQIPSLNRPVLQGISLSLQPGQSIAILGACGAGKSSLIEIILGIASPTSGEVRLDGADVADWPKAHLGQFIGYLPQSVDLLSGTVADNIARHGKIDSEKVVTAAKLAGVHELILELPGGYDTKLGNRAESLSGGTRQRIALARAVYGDIRLLVLDEPTANLDQIGERALLQVINKMKQQKVTVVIVSHKITLFRQIDLALTLNKGRIEKLGPMIPPAPKAVTTTTLSKPQIEVTYV